MKQLFTYLVGFSLLAITTISCSKEEQNESRPQAQAVAPQQVVSASVSAGQTYFLSMSTGSTASIKTQALHYAVSEIATAPDGSSVYRYSAAKGFAGADEVTLQQTITSTSQGGGCSNGNSNHTTEQTTTTYKAITIKFNVAN